MKRFLICLLTASFCISMTVVAASSHKRLEIRFVPGEILVKYKEGTGAAKAAALNARLGTRTIKHFSHLGLYRKKLPDTMSVQQAVSLFKADPSVEYAEPNYIRMPSATPNDASFSQLWGLNNTGQTVNGAAGASGCDISACQAWDIVTDGSAVTVAVIDTGVDIGHTDIVGNTSAGYDYVEDNASPIDTYGHGTHVAGTIGAVGNNATGVAGINWTARIMPVRAGDSNGLTTADIVNSVDHARDNGAKIINASYGGYDYSISERDAISRAAAAGILFVASAGNETNDNDVYPVYPASYGLSNIIAVAATNQSDGLCNFSNYGKNSVHVGAPGRNIYSLGLSRADHWTENFAAAGGWALDGTWAVAGGVLTNKPYVNSADCSAISPVIDLTGASYCRVEFQLTGACEEGDILSVDISGDSGATWPTSLVLVSGDASDAWYSLDYDIRALDALATVKIRFHFTSDGSGTSGGGFNIRNLKLTKYLPGSTNYAYMDGTSMAAPHVAGMAALLWSRFPGYTMEQIRYMIINSADPVSSLSDKTVSGGRINIYNAMNLPAEPTLLTATKSAPARAELSWTSNSPGASGFKIECKAGSGGTWSQIATVPVTETAYSHIGAPTGATVYYRVRAYSSTGNSFYSNEATITTDTATKVDGSGSGCFIATATYGSPRENSVGILRVFRDRYLLASAPGRALVKFYYKSSPPLADFISRHESARVFARLMLAPAVLFSSVAINGGPEILVSMLLFMTAAVFVIFRLIRFSRTSAF